MKWKGSMDMAYSSKSIILKVSRQFTYLRIIPQIMLSVSGLWQEPVWVQLSCCQHLTLRVTPRHGHADDTVIMEMRRVCVGVCLSIHLHIKVHTVRGWLHATVCVCVCVFGIVCVCVLLLLFLCMFIFFMFEMLHCLVLKHINCLGDNYCMSNHIICHITLTVIFTDTTVSAVF